MVPSSLPRFRTAADNAMPYRLEPAAPATPSSRPLLLSAIGGRKDTPTSPYITGPQPRRARASFMKAGTQTTSSLDAQFVRAEALLAVTPESGRLASRSWMPPIQDDMDHSSRLVDSPLPWATGPSSRSSGTALSSASSSSEAGSPMPTLTSAVTTPESSATPLGGDRQCPLSSVEEILEHYLDPNVDYTPSIYLDVDDEARELRALPGMNPVFWDLMDALLVKLRDAEDISGQHDHCSHFWVILRSNGIPANVCSS
ncbi:hypothetical protein EVJ58_g7871 [Rhodofomes roseus]|uniref:Uncharacterized protein n=1 Tax=Rhodofomes roseus TaxID=34475 RepID=A0A4Y9Y0P1_9APHY|nr:hypothetical protein EVJ58_g7871 [Rhodofomes roseus]